MMEQTKVLEIGYKNDRFRKSGFGVTITSGIQDLPDIDGLMAAIRDFDTFTEDNDPYGERDFGSLVWHSEKVFWKIDYYNKALNAWEDPTLDQCQRVLTVMLAEEY
jgi:hypothetical protein